MVPASQIDTLGQSIGQDAERGEWMPRVEGSKGLPALPGQVVLVLQGGGALGAYQGGVYQALHEAKVELDWVIGTSIGAINGTIIAGNESDQRLDRLREFWDRMTRKAFWDPSQLGLMNNNIAAQLMTIFGGVSGYFAPNHALVWGLHAPIGVERAGFYTIEALHETLTGLLDLARVNSGKPRLTVGAVNVRSGKMHYFDSRDLLLTLNHVLASGALPPAFPAICIDGDPYWDGGIYSNTPIEIVFDDHPRRDSVVRLMPEQRRETPVVKEMADFGCGTIMHIVRLNAPRLDHEDHLRDIDFTSGGIHARWQAGYADTMRVLECRPWETPIDPMMGVAVHDSNAPDGIA
jgi:NTE family protein